jgi:hypothetical protein
MSLESHVVLHRRKEAGNLLRGNAHRLDAVLGQQPADAVECRADLGQISDGGRFLRGRCDSLQWIEGPSDLLVTVAVPPEGGPKKVQFTKQAFRVTEEQCWQIL